MKDFVLSGTVEAASCGTEETSCPVPPVPAPGVEIDATGPEDASVSTGEDGVYTMYLEPGAYTVTPGMGDFTFDPSSRPVDLSHGAGEADFTLLGFPDGIDWKMPDRVELGTKVSPDGGLPPARYVYPRVWSAELYLTEDGKRVTSCPAGFTWEWDVTPLHTSGNGEPTVTQPEDGCSTSFTTTQLGTYRVAAKTYQQTGEGLAKAGPGVDTPDVVLNDLLIVGLGDSNGSGEGDPPFYFDQCHRVQRPDRVPGGADAGGTVRRPRPASRSFPRSWPGCQIRT